MKACENCGKCCMGSPMEVNKIICGDTLETVKTFPDESIDCVITSPPYYQLRDYGWDGQWGLEPTYQEYLDKLIELMKELKRVLKPTGTMWINLGDSYSTLSGGTRGLLRNEKQFGSISHKAVLGQGFNQIKPKEYPKKSLMLIPHRFAIRCIDELGLILRNDIIWAKRNGMPESVTNRFSKKHEFIFFFVKEPKYYFDLDSIRDKPITKEKRSKRIVYNSSKNDETNKTNTFIPPNPKGKNPGDVADFWNKNIKGNMTKDGLTRTTAGLNLKSAEEKINPLGKNLGDVSDFWDIPTKPNKEKHYATYNSQLIDKPIIAGCPEGGIILDPFCGIGTTLVRAIELNRNAIGIDGKKEYCEIAQAKLNEVLRQQKLFSNIKEEQCSD